MVHFKFFVTFMPQLLIAQINNQNIRRRGNLINKGVYRRWSYLRGDHFPKVVSRQDFILYSHRIQRSTIAQVTQLLGVYHLCTWRAISLSSSVQLPIHGSNFSSEFSVKFKSILSVFVNGFSSIFY